MIRDQGSGVRGQGLGVRRKLRETHISGAEGIYKGKNISKIVKEYIKRAVNHPRGKPDEIVITIEKIKQKIKTIPLLSVKTLKCKSPDEAKETIIQKLASLGISKKAVNNGFKVLKAGKAMRGASLVLAESGMRVEPDKNRGVRVSRMGIEENAEKKLSQMLCKIVIPAKAGHPQRLAGARIQSKETGFRVKPGMTGTCNKIIKNNTTTVKEALILASKVASCPDIIAEVCISDDPDYTTGYFASEKEGYLRLANIKKSGEMHGGRVFFIKEDADIAGVIQYLEGIPVIIRRI
ncbi:MAG: 6-carboxyhexanoate--CoA ligase [Thermodesulfovibrionales bacterium]|nr:6-carboxyhexanoate--CoA ligase [Thermodesulfovibrionales bacterium]